MYKHAPLLLAGILIALCSQVASNADTLTISISSDKPIAEQYNTVTVNGNLSLTSSSSEADYTNAWILTPYERFVFLNYQFANNCTPSFNVPADVVGEYTGVLDVFFDNPQGQQMNLSNSASLYLPGPSPTPPTNPPPTVNL